MTKFFNAAVSNPPYQETLGGNTVIATYPAFIHLGSVIAEQSAMIHPARAFKKAGRYVKEDVETILNNNNFTIEAEFENEKEVFPNTQIKGGIIISKHNSDNNGLNNSKSFKNLSPLYLTTIKNRVEQSEGFVSIKGSIYSFLDNRISNVARDELSHYESMRTAPNKHEFKTNIFSTIPELFIDEAEFENGLLNGVYELGDYRVVWGYSKGRRKKYIHKRYVKFSEDWHGWKVFVPNSSTVRGARIGEPVIADEDSLATQTFITFGMFDNESEAINCAKYVKTVFARGLLSVLKTTQHNSRHTWLYVPMQGFSQDSDIQWDYPLSEIDKQLFKKYGLSDDEIEWLYENIDEMD